MKIEYLKSPNFEQVKRRSIKYIIIHYTGMKTAQESIKRLRSKKHKVSSHYFINEGGKIFLFRVGILLINKFIICSDASKSAITPSFNGRIVLIFS